jgi:O-antigen ligase
LTRDQSAARVFLSAHPAFLYFMPVPEIFYAEKMGSLVNANLLSVFALPMFILLVAKTLEVRRRSQRRFYWAIGAASALVCLVLSKSGSSWMALSIALMALAAWFHGGDLIRRHKKIVVGAATLATVALVAALVFKFTHAVDHRVDPHRDNFNRLYWWLSALRMFADFPWTGVGAGGYGSAYLTYKIGGTENTLYAHGFPFALLAETGLVGAITFGILLLSWLGSVRALSPRRLAAHPPLVALLAVALFCSINIGLEYLVNLLVLAILAGFTVSGVSAPAIRPRSSVAIVLVALAVGAAPFLLSPLFASRATVTGEADLAAGDLTGAEKNFKDAIELDPRAWEPYVGLARIADKQNDRASAVQWQLKAWERNRLSLPLQRDLENYQRRER